jgi:hypothetical protein
MVSLATKRGDLVAIWRDEMGWEGVNASVCNDVERRDVEAMAMHLPNAFMGKGGMGVCVLCGSWRETDPETKKDNRKKRG